MQNHNRKSRWVRRALWVTFVLGFITAAFAVTRPSSFSTIPAYVFALLARCLFPFWVIPLQRRAFRKRFVLEKQNLTNAHVWLDDSGYHIEVLGVGSGIAEWGSMSKWMEGKSVIILLTGLLMRIVPKAPLSQKELDGLRQLLMKQIAPAAVNR